MCRRANSSQVMKSLSLDPGCMATEAVVATAGNWTNGLLKWLPVTKSYGNVVMSGCECIGVVVDSCLGAGGTR